MKSKTYCYGKTNCKSYIKPVGKGYEVGFYVGERLVFVGNFIHPKEAVGWWSLMNKEISWFGAAYTKGYQMPVSWVQFSIKSHLYKTYYKYLDKIFGKYGSTFTRAFDKSVTQFKRSKHKFKKGAPGRAYLKVA